MPNYACHWLHLPYIDPHYLNKASFEISVQSLKDLSSKCRRSAKDTKIMPNYAN